MIVTGRQKTVTAECMGCVDDFDFQVDLKVLEFRDKQIEDNLQEVKEIRFKLAQAKSELETLGFFKFSAKKKLKAEITDMILKMNELLKSETVKEQMKDLDSKGKQLKDSYRAQMEEYLGNRFPYEREKKKAMGGAAPQGGNGIRSLILLTLQEHGSCTIEEMMKNNEQLQQFSTQRVSAVVRMMHDEGLVNRHTRGARIYFESVDSSDVFKDILKDLGIEEGMEDMNYTDQMRPITPSIEF